LTVERRAELAVVGVLDGGCGEGGGAADFDGEHHCHRRHHQDGSNHRNHRKQRAEHLLLPLSHPLEGQPLVQLLPEQPVHDAAK
jgi:hypothetical protein